MSGGGVLGVLLVVCMVLAGCRKWAGENSASRPMESSLPSASSQSADLPTASDTEVVLPEQQLQEDKSYIFVQRDTDATDGGVQQLVKSMEANGQPFYETQDNPKGLIAADDVVLLKINCQWAERGGTNTDLVRAVAQAVAAHPDGFTGEIVIADNGQAQYGTNGTGGSLDWEKSNSAQENQSIQNVIDSLRDQMKISGYLWDTITLNRVSEYADGDDRDGFVIEDVLQPTGFEISYPKFTTRHGTQISFKNGVWNKGEQRYDSDRLKVINLPVLKQHFIYHVTGAVKSYMGVVANQLTGHRAHNNVGNGAMGTLMAQTRMPVLNLMDMIWVGSGNGPGTTYDMATPTRMLAASTDPVALDYWAAKYVLLPEVKKLSLNNAANIDPDVTLPGSFGYWLGLSFTELQKAGLPSHNREDDMILIDPSVGES